MKEKTAAEKRLETIHENQIAKEKRNKEIAEKRAATIKAKEEAQRKIETAQRRKKKLESLNGTKPIFWIFFLFGWLNALYWLFVIVRFLLKTALGT